tara:strand:- start:382 stop:2010 length:1629 start_codon:yes stop_codon:yes gene_type:complete
MTKPALATKFIDFLKADRTTSGSVKKSDVLENGFLNVGTPEFKNAFAYHSSGYALVNLKTARSHTIQEEQRKLIKGGVIPSDVTEKQASAEQLAAVFDVRTQTGDTFNAVTMVNRLYAIFNQAAILRASDVKFIVRSHSTEMRIYAGGKEHPFPEAGITTVKDGKAAIKVLFEAREINSGQTSYMDGVMQDFAIQSTKQLRLPPNVASLRCAKGGHVTSTGAAEHLVARIYPIQNNKETQTLESLGLDEEVLDALDYMRSLPSGLCINAGSTGQGKNTTVVRAIERLHVARNGQLAIMTVESPVEISLEHLDGVVQISVPNGLNQDDNQKKWDDVQDHLKRTHPDVAFYGEIRNKKIAQQVFEFVGSGHVVYTTLHAQSAVMVPFDLISKGLSPESVSQPNFIGLCMCQVLVPVLCLSCAKEYSSTSSSPNIASATNIKFESVKIRSGEGCDKCYNKETSDSNIWKGYQRVIAVAEILIPDNKFLEFTMQKNAVGAMAHWLLPKDEGGLGGIRISDKLLDLVNSGQVDPNDAINIGLAEALN